MKYLFHFLTLSFALIGITNTAQAGELVLGAAGKSPYQIVIPDKFNNDDIQKSVQQAADLLQQAFAAQQIQLAITTEAKAIDKPGIYVGNTRFAQEHGVTFKPDQGWTYTWKTVGRNLIIAGNDQPDPMPMDKRREREARRGGIPILGTLKSVCEFVYKYAGARFVAPDSKHGLVFLPTPVLFIPDDLNTTQQTYASNLEISRSSSVYSIANGMQPFPTALTNYGHYHHAAINSKSHGKTNPEYFIYRAGKRQTDEEHYCFSNPAVRETIYNKILEHADLGYTLIEMGQNDGFIPCNCEDCYALYGIHPTYSKDAGRAYLMDAAWGEKLWIMHRDMAMRLKQDRPNVKLMISAYSVARNPPKTIDSFPDNVIIQIMRPRADIFEAWNRIDIPGGYAAYLYTWGTFHIAGYTPIRSQFEIEQLAKVLTDNNVRLIQINGKPKLYGIEGVNIYALMRMLNDPTAKPLDDYYDEYINAAYQEAAGPMRSFYRKLHHRLMFKPEARHYARELNRNPLLLFNTLYTPDLMQSLESHLATAERLAEDAGVKERLEAARLEFDYLKHIVNPINHYYAYLSDKTQATHVRAIEAVEQRNQWLAQLANDGGRVGSDRPTFQRLPLRALKQNSRYLNVEPFNWNTQQRRNMDITSIGSQAKRMTASKAKQPITIDSPQWEQAAEQTLDASAKNKEPLQAKTTFKILYDEQNLYVRVEAQMQAADMQFEQRGRDAEIWLQSCIFFNVSPTGDKSQYYYLNWEPVTNSFTDAQHGFITDPLHPRFGWNDNTWDGDWSYVNKLDRENNQWITMAVVPYKTIGADLPEKGATWMINVGRVHHFDNKTKRELSVWSEEVNVSNVPGDAYLGELIFE